MLRTTVSSALLALILSSQTAYAIEATEKTCADALEGLGLSSDSYVLDEGFFGDTHKFGGNIECTESRGHLKIRSGGEIVAEDGFYGAPALAARKAAQAALSEQISALKAEKDKKDDAAEREYKLARSAAEKESQSQLEQIRNNNIPVSIVAAVNSEQKERVAKEERRAEEKALKAAQRDKEKAEKRDQEIKEEAENKRKGFHCLGGWNGDQRYVTKAIKENLNDPGSFDYEEIRVTPVENGRHNFIMTYRAKNGFGALVMGTAEGSYSNADCSDVLFTSTN